MTIFFALSSDERTWTLKTNKSKSDLSIFATSATISLLGFKGSSLAISLDSSSNSILAISSISVAAFEFRFMGGSMGGVVGEKFVQGVNEAIKSHCPFICFSTSGGARMQESMISLMQMAKTSAALQKLKAEKLPYISVMVDPIYGGVSASLAMLGDINIAEPDALVGFAGRRVIEQTVRVDLPDDFQKSEFLLKHGAIDMIVHRRNIRTKVHGLLKKIYKA